MSSISSTLIASSFSAAYLFHSWEVLKVKKIQIPKYMYLFLFAFLVIIITINYFYTTRFLGLVLLIVILTMFNMLIYHNSLKTAFLTVVFSESIAILGEVTCAFLYYGAIELFDVNNDINTGGFNLFNLFVPLFSVLLIHFPFIKKLKEKILIQDNKLENHQIIFPLTVLMISVNILIATLYYQIDGLLLVGINCSLMLIYLVIIINALKDKNQVIKVKEENKELTHHLREYENILIKQRRKNHESKTELVVVRDMLNSNFKKGMKCLDEVIGTKEELDETFYERCQQMPSGIQGVIYQRLLVADPEIKTYIEVSPKIKKEELETQMTSDIFLDACKILGVFIGNAVEEVEEIKDKNNKVISVQLYLEGNDTLVVQIGNTYRKGTDFNKLGEEGYTTKEEEHGQGLSLVKELEEKHENLDHETVVNGKLLFQKLNIRGLEL